MTLDEAIIHAEEVAEINENIAYNTDSENWMDIAQCEKCAEEHRQLAEWLKELKQYQWIPVSERLPDLKIEVIYSFYGTVSTGYMTDRDYKGEKTESHWEDLESGVTIEPTHWMPLPPPYEGGETA